MTDFERWWYDEGSSNRPVDEDIEEFSKRMCEIAWSNGAFKEREACARVCESLWRIDGQFTADEFAAEIRSRGGNAA
jgi:hypothetical protein